MLLVPPVREDNWIGSPDPNRGHRNEPPQGACAPTLSMCTASTAGMSKAVKTSTGNWNTPSIKKGNGTVTEVYNKWDDHLGTIHSTDSESLPFRAVGYYNHYAAEDLGWFSTKDEAESRIWERHREP